MFWLRNKKINFQLHTTLIWVPVIMLNIYILHSSPVSIMLTCSIPVVNMYFQSEWKTVWILIRWLCQKHLIWIYRFFRKRINLGSAGQGLTILCPENAILIILPLLHILKCTPDKFYHKVNSMNPDLIWFRVPTEIQNHNSMIFHDQQCNFHDYLMHSLQPPLLAASSPC